VKRFPLAAQLALAVALGIGVGLAAGPRAAVLGEAALLVIKLLKALAAPLVLFAIVDAFATTRIAPVRGLQLLALSTLNAVVAAGIALALANLWPVERTVDLAAIERAIAAPSPAAAPAPGSSAIAAVGAAMDRVIVSRVLWVIAAALALGIALRAWKAAGRAPDALAAVEKFVHRGLGVAQRLIGWAVHLVPLAAFGVLAKVVGTSGFAVFAALGVFVAMVACGLLLHAFGWYALLLRSAGVRVARFFADAGAALATALSTGSSLATLPVTLRTLERRGVSTEAARLAACVGTNLNHDGILLYEAVAALFIARAHGLHLGAAAQLKLCVTSALAAVGIAGVPEAGLITLSLVLGAVGLPLAAVPLLLPVDWLLGRLRATVNVTSDLTVATLLDRWRGVARPSDS
jgi:DAACS family dicarboxylate/amino acid:cation (Na+ or H+) symporter